MSKMTCLQLSGVLFQALNAENSFSTGTPPRTPLGELTTLPQTPSRLGRGTSPPLPIPLYTSPSTPSASRSRRLWPSVVRPTQIPGYTYMAYSWPTVPSQKNLAPPLQVSVGPTTGIKISPAAVGIQWHAPEGMGLLQQCCRCMA